LTYRELVKELLSIPGLEKHDYPIVIDDLNLRFPVSLQKVEVEIEGNDRRIILTGNPTLGIPFTVPKCREKQ
jgi:hypothetical protein